MFKFENKSIKLWDVIGRSVGVTDGDDICTSQVNSSLLSKSTPAMRYVFLRLYLHYLLILKSFNVFFVMLGRD